MTLTELRYIVAVARERHFGRAAASCFVSQPTLSVAIKKLEEQLGVTLFERYQHDIRVTAIGEKIIEQARLVIEEADKIKAIASESENALTGQLKLGVIYTVGPYLLPKLIPAIHKAAPELKLVIEENFTHELGELLRQGELDMIIVSTPFNIPTTETRYLYSEPFMVALPTDHPLTRKKSIRLEDLFDETLLLLRTGNCFRDQVLEACSSCMSQQFSRENIQKTLEGSSLETIRQMVAAGTGVTILPATTVSEGPDMKGHLEYRPFVKPAPERDVILACRKSYPRTALVDLVENTIGKIRLKGISIAA